MTFPMMPKRRPQFFAQGALTQVLAYVGGMSSHSLSLGGSSGSRWIVVVAVGNGADAIGAWTAPTIDGVSMTLIVTDGPNISSDGQRGAIWVFKETSKETVTLAGSLPTSNYFKAFVLTGVKDATTGYLSQAGSPGVSASSPVPSCAVAYGVHSGGSFTSISGMTTNGVTSGFGPCVVGHNARTTVNPNVYTYTGTGLAASRFVTWVFDY